MDFQAVSHGTYVSRVPNLNEIKAGPLWYFESKEQEFMYNK